MLAELLAVDLEHALVEVAQLLDLLVERAAGLRELVRAEDAELVLQAQLALRELLVLELVLAEDLVDLRLLALDVDRALRLVVLLVLVHDRQLVVRLVVLKQVAVADVLHVLHRAVVLRRVAVLRRR